MTAATNTKPIGLLGGTFDPIHHGHLRLALELYERLDLAEVRLLPAASPPHKNQPMADSQLRLAMVQAAVANVQGLIADGRELNRQGHSYTVETLQEIRAEMGAERPLYLIMGMDAFMSLSSWYQWEQLIHYAHLLVVRRPGALLPMVHQMQVFMREHQVSEDNPLTWQPSGTVIVEDIPGLMISSTQVRALLVQGKNPQYLLPESVLKLIYEQGLYGSR